MRLIFVLVVFIYGCAPAPKMHSGSAVEPEWEYVAGCQEHPNDPLCAGLKK